MRTKAVLAWQRELTDRYDSLRKHTLLLAKQNGWPLRKNYSSQRLLQLQAIDTFGQPVYYTLHNVEAARGTRTLALQGGGTLPVALSGNSAMMAGRLGLWDGGLVLNSHQEFGGSATSKSKIVQKDIVSTVNSHATHLAGTLVGLGSNPQAKGMAYRASLSVWDYTNDLAELAVAAPGLLVSNHAYGPVAGWVYNDSRPGTNPDLKWEWWGNIAISPTEDYLFGFYNTTVQDLDRMAYNNPFFLMVRSADNKRSETGPPSGTPYFLKDTDTQSTVARSRNDGYDVIPADGTAKNILTVGAAEVRYADQNQPVLVGSTAFSGWGPTDDGRIKPDLLGIGSDVLSSIATTNTAYGLYSGTSMASANVSGSLFLLQELYATHQRPAGLPATGQFMRAATLKGLALHTAGRLNPEMGPTYRQGWGLLNTEAAARLLLNENQAHLVLEQGLPAGSSFSRKVVAQGNEPLIITLSWTDPEGIPTSAGTGALNNRTPKLVNDLDLRLGDGQYTEFPFVLDPAKPDKMASRGDNIRDNVEQIYIANPVPGKNYTISVTHKGTMRYASQPFSILVSGLYRANCQQLIAAIQPVTETVICEGVPVKLQATVTAANLNYQWLRDGTIEASSASAVYQATKPGSYVLRITDRNGCSALSEPIVLQTPSIGIVPDGNQWLCDDGKPVLLTATATSGEAPTGITYRWLFNNNVIANANVSTLSAAQPGRYRVEVSKNGCRMLSAETIVLSSTVNKITILPEATELRLPQGATLTLKAPVDTSYQYQWYKNNNLLLNAHNYSLLLSQAGTYKVQVTQHTCVGFSADRIVETSVLTATTADPVAQLTFYPNPSETTLSIRYVNALMKQVQIRITDLQGREWQAPRYLKTQNGEIQYDISIQQLPAGNYILSLTDGSISQTGRFIKK